MKPVLASDQEEDAAKRVVPTVAGKAFAELLSPEGPRRQPLAGFDDDYLDIVDYIVRCTHRIWEERQHQLILTHYTPDCVIHTLGGEVRGADTVVENTVATLRAFPDRELIPESVIWSGSDRDGFYTSHRIFSPMTNLGDSDFGPPTGRRCEVRTIADCRVKANRIFEEWLVRDNRALVQQLGRDPASVAATLAVADLARPAGAWSWIEGEIERVRGGRAGAEDGGGSVLGDARERFEALWKGSAPPGLYADACRVEGPGGRRFAGAGDAASLVAEVRAGLGDLRLTVDHLAAIPYLDAGHEVAIRWSLAARHTGSYLIAPTGADVLILAVTHWRVVDGRVVEEWTVFDEIGVLRQMLRKGGVAG
jgi:predicted ester cyclase